MSSVLDLINAIEAGKTRECESAFESLIHAKIAQRMEERRAEIRANMFESEQLDELSKDTLGSYVKKASKERGYSGLEAGSAGAGSKEQKDAVNTMKKRQAGVVKAVDRLTKESEDLDEEQLDEGGDSEQKLLDLAKYAKKDKDMVAHHQYMSEYYKNHADKARGTNHKGGAGSFIANYKKANEHKMKAINLKAKSGQ